MSYESLNTLDRSVILRETFNSSFLIQKNCYYKGVIVGTGLIKNGSIKLTNNSKVKYLIRTNHAINAHSVRVKFRLGKIPDTGLSCMYSLGDNFIFSSVTINFATKTIDFRAPYSLLASADITQYLIENATLEIVQSCSSGTTNASCYINGKLVTSRSKSVSNPINTSITFGAAGGGSFIGIELLEAEVYNEKLSASEVKLLYQQRLYTQSTELPLLLDYDSTRGIIEDRTSKNNISFTNTSIIKIGKVYSAYFNGVSSRITIPNIIKQNITISLWVYIHSSGTNWLLSNGNYYLYYLGGRFFQHYNSSNYGTFQIIGNKRWINLISIIGSNNIGTIFINGGAKEQHDCGVFANGIANLTIGTSSPSSFTSSLKGYFAKFQLFQGTPTDPDQFAIQLYNSQKGQFGL
jgi:hypothetical protein